MMKALWHANFFEGVLENMGNNLYRLQISE